MNTAIRIESTDKELSARGGLLVFKEAAESFSWAKSVEPHLPSYKIANEADGLSKFKALVYGFAAGADCLDEMERLARDEGFASVSGYVNSATVYGGYLRMFTPFMLKNLNYSLIETAFECRRRIAKRRTSVTFSIDSTEHLQHGKKMEGVRQNRLGETVLDSLVVFDELGFQYWTDVRPGATFTANGSAEVVHAVSSRMPKNLRKYWLADSGFCNADFFNACAASGGGFICAMRENMYAPIIGRVTNWKLNRKHKFHDGRSVEMGTTLYRPGRGEKILRVVFLRALNPAEAQRNGLFKDTAYDYVAFVTNIGEHEISNENIVSTYRGRANAENFIREQKYGFDLKHFPCKKLDANRAYALIAGFAFNLMRYISHIEDPAQQHFSKIIRFRVLMLPVQVVKHARSISFRFMEHHAQEVRRWIRIINSHIGLSNASFARTPTTVL